MAKLEHTMQHFKTSFDLEKLVLQYQKQLREEAMAYLQKRNITEETVNEYQIGFDADKIGFLVNQDAIGDYFANRIIIPLKDETGQTVDLIGRAIDHREPKYKALYGIDDVLFNKNILKDSDDVVLCAGIFDVLTLSQENIPAICLPTKLNFFKEHHAKQLKDKRVFICFGNDEAGRRESTRIAGLLQDHSKEIFKVNLPENIRDVNDLFVRSQNPIELFLMLLNKSIEDSLLEPVAPDVRHMIVFTEEYLKRHRNQDYSISTGMQALDESLHGGFVSGLYLLTGSSSSGKSMLVKQWADTVAHQHTPVIHFTWDHSHFECWAMSIARILGHPPFKVIRGLVPPEQILSANQTYVQMSKMLWTIEGTYQTKFETLVASVEQVLGMVDRSPVIFIDHLQRVPASPKLAGAHDSQASTAYMLKQLSTEWNCPIITAVTKGEEDVLNEGVLASADVVWQLKRDPFQRRRIDLQFTKHRFGTLNHMQLNFEPDKALFRLEES